MHIITTYLHLKYTGNTSYFMYTIDHNLFASEMHWDYNLFPAYYRPLSSTLGIQIIKLQVHTMTETTRYDLRKKKKAQAFDRHFASISRATTHTDEQKERIQNLKDREHAPSANISLFEDPFNKSELKKAMRKLKARKSPGPDKVHNEMLIHLGPIGKSVVLHLINQTWSESYIPRTWRNAIITPILKKDKPAEEMKSYRPISLTSCIGKLAERMVNNLLYWWLETTGVLNNTQAGFRAGQRTEDQLFRLTQKTLDGFQDKKHTIAVFVDLQQAYDRVWRKGLLWKMTEMGIHGNM